MLFAFINRQPSLTGSWLLATAMGAVQFGVALLFSEPAPSISTAPAWISATGVLMVIAGPATYRHCRLTSGEMTR